MKKEEIKAVVESIAEYLPERMSGNEEIRTMNENTRPGFSAHVRM
jgi:hypothetical protein